MIKRVRLRKYKGFHHFDLTLRSFNLLVGPNNAGKSTAVAVLRLAAILLRTARRLNPNIKIEDNGRTVVGYPLSAARIRDLPGYSEENVHHEFRDEEARVELVSDTEFTIVIVWPADQDEAYFYLDYKPGMNARKRSQIDEHAPQVDVVPGLTPVDHREELLTAKYVNDSLGSRLTSRHFRNHLYHLQKQDPAEFEDMVSFLCRHTPEIEGLSVRSVMTSDGMELDVFFQEVESNSEREIFWAGDGLQIWLQVLFHCHRLRAVEALVLDEPDVFLHPDLQRRLVAMLEELSPQITVATHAPEVIAEASRDSIVWVDRTRKNARRVQDTAGLDRVVSDLGSAFDLSIARALRSRVVLFVEGHDMKVLRILADKAGAHNLSKERRPVAVVPLGGFSNWPLIEPFAWLKDSLLQDAVKVFVVLDRDYRDNEECRRIVAQLATNDVVGHIWKRKELESYLLVPSLLGRVCGLDPARVETLLDEVVDAQEKEVEANLFSKIQRDHKDLDAKSVFERLRVRMGEVWESTATKRQLAPPKVVIAKLNERIREEGGRPVSVRKLADAMRRAELDDEVREFLLDVEAAILDKND